jgi:exonuclease III
VTLNTTSLTKENRKRPIISYLNINSIRYKFDDLQQILHDKLCDMLIISETNLDISFNNNLFTVDGYKMERRDWNSNGGGMLTFVRADLPFKGLRIRFSRRY